ncbi:multiple epidermal growth factor-like domains protein 10 isoform X2 [Mytilus californianus]|uniref:multiple epidermal growth factor-like domains protein 10 isoform X2 n=1 Tax=Mytilus californianus TaxID=6549 RepID=UPI0022458BD6|nr:multiple epidermal growth factor-like domains protein 10 isoform X2 [Mytilus californianus]
MLLVLLIHTTCQVIVTAQHNLTPFGIATQSSYIGGYIQFGKPEYAIKPPISNEWSFYVCSHTNINRSRTPADWWMFELSFESAFITDITIYYREGFARRMDGFKLCVTNTSTTPPVSDSCYEDPDPGLPNITQTIPFNQLGKYVIYYDNKGSTEVDGRYDGPVIELCYVAINGCQKSFWGSNCEVSCAVNCINGNCFPGNGSCIWGCNPVDCLNDFCNKDTAVCTDGCKERKTGNHCNKYNLASDSLVTQNPSGTAVASIADGNKTSCSRTLGKNVTFLVDLKKASIVTGILITFGEHTITEGNHSVYASNTSSGWKNGTVLYDGKSFPTEIGFFAVFRYLTFVSRVQHPYAMLELCEIGVVGCPPTHYGPVCTYSCPQNCQGPCDLESGNCIFGCFNGWTGYTCEQACNGGRYGQDCLEECSANCLNPQCNHVTGECIDGCKDGWQGFNCTQKCPNGQFGTKCLELCEGCLSYMCDHVDGLCDNTTVCKPGYVYGKYCNKECNNWYFGNNCLMECNCLVEPCNKVDGICPLGGCKEGWHGKSCDQRCSKGYFGRNCDRPCDGCISQSCEATDGLCYNTTGCEPGYLYDEYCNNTCDNWYFGNNCTMKCNCLTGPCSWFTGTCPPGGCKKGWQGDSCDKVSAKTVQSNCLLSTQVGLFIGGFLLGVLMTVAVCILVHRKRQLRKKQGKDNNTEQTQSHEQQHYDDVQHVQMENVSTYQDLMTHPTSNVYDQINTAYINQ